MASGISTIFSPENPNELYDRYKLLIQERPAGINSSVFDEKNVAIIDKLLEYKSISTQQHKQVLRKCNF